MLQGVACHGNVRSREISSNLTPGHPPSKRLIAAQRNEATIIDIVSSVRCTGHRMYRKQSGDVAVVIPKVRCPCTAAMYIAD